MVRLVPVEGGVDWATSQRATKSSQIGEDLKDCMSWEPLPQEPAVYEGMLQHSGEEQGTDSQVSEMVEKLPGKIWCH